MCSTGKERTLGFKVAAILIGVLGGFIALANFGLSLVGSEGGRFVVPLLHWPGLVNTLNFILGIMGLLYVVGAVGVFRLRRWALYLIFLATLFQIANLIYRVAAFSPPLPIVIAFWGVYTVLGIVAALFVAVKRRMFR